MSKATRDEKLTISSQWLMMSGQLLRVFRIFRVKVTGDMLAKGWRAFADIDDNIPSRAFDDAHEFRLGMWRRLPVKTADNALMREAFVVLNEITCDTRLFVTPGIVRLAKPTTRVSESIGLDDFHALNRRINNFHQTRSFRYCP